MQLKYFVFAIDQIELRVRLKIDYTTIDDYWKTIFIKIELTGLVDKNFKKIRINYWSYKVLKLIFETHHQPPKPGF